MTAGLGISPVIDCGAQLVSNGDGLITILQPVSAIANLKRGLVNLAQYDGVNSVLTNMPLVIPSPGTRGNAKMRISLDTEGQVLASISSQHPSLALNHFHYYRTFTADNSPDVWDARSIFQPLSESVPALLLGLSANQSNVLTAVQCLAGSCQIIFQETGVTSQPIDLYASNLDEIYLARIPSDTDAHLMLVDLKYGTYRSSTSSVATWTETASIHPSTSSEVADKNSIHSSNDGVVVYARRFGNAAIGKVELFVFRP